MGNTKQNTERKKAKKEEKQLKKEVAQKMNMFSRLPDECLSCLSAFDKTNREMIASWTVIVKEAEKKVNLYCPTCWDTARTVVEDYYKERENNE
jgi:hypothetical protein